MQVHAMGGIIVLFAGVRGAVCHLPGTDVHVLHLFVPHNTKITVEYKHSLCGQLQGKEKPNNKLGVFCARCTPPISLFRGTAFFYTAPAFFIAMIPEFG